MKQNKLRKRIAAWMMCLAMVLATVNLSALTTEVKAAEEELIEGDNTITVKTGEEKWYEFKPKSAGYYLFTSDNYGYSVYPNTEKTKDKIYGMGPEMMTYIKFDSTETHYISFEGVPSDYNIHIEQIETTLSEGTNTLYSGQAYLVIYEFTPTKTGNYKVSSGSFTGNLYFDSTKDGNTILKNGEAYVDLIAGTTYYVVLQASKASYDIDIELVVEEHDFSKYESNGDGTHKVMCKDCDVVKEGHDKDACTNKTTTTKATLSANGKKVVKCSLCGETSTSTIYYPKTFTLSATSYTYDGKAKKPTVTVKDSNGKTVASKNYTVSYTDAAGKAVSSPTNVGAYKAKIVFKNDYNGTKNIAFRIVPKKATIKKLESGAQSIVITWDKGATGTTGYEVYRATSKSGSYTKVATIKKIGTVTYTDKSLTVGKTYYYKVRAYATIDGKNVFGSYSDVKSVATYTNTEAFVARIYTKAFGRAPEEAGLKYWAGEINAKRKTPVEVAELFIFSDEFTKKNLNDTEYVKVLYRTFMGREYDQAGLNYWLGQMKAGKTRKQVLESFASCKEFQDIIKNFGL